MVRTRRWCAALLALALLLSLAPPTAAGTSLVPPELYKRQGWHGANQATIFKYTITWLEGTELYARQPDGRDCWLTEGDFWCEGDPRPKPPVKVHEDPKVQTWEVDLLCVWPANNQVRGEYTIVLAPWEEKIQTIIGWNPPGQAIWDTRIIPHDATVLNVPVRYPDPIRPGSVKTWLEPGFSWLVQDWAPSQPGLGHLPDSCWTLKQGVGSREILYQVAPLAVQPKVTVLADTAAWKVGEPQTIYVRVDHDATAPLCPVDVALDLPAWFRLDETQGARVTAGKVPSPKMTLNLATGDWTPTQRLSWSATLKPGRPFERWVRVVPSDPPEGVWQTAVLTEPVTIRTGNEELTAPEASLMLSYSTRMGLNAEVRPAGEGAWALTVKTEIAGQPVQDQVLRLTAGGAERVVYLPEGGTGATVLLREAGAPPVLDWYQWEMTVPLGTGDVALTLTARSYPAGEERTGPTLTVPLTGGQSGPWSEAKWVGGTQAGAVPPARDPLDAMGPEGCTPASYAAEQRIQLTASPPVLREKNQYTSTITARLLGTPEKSSLPLTLQAAAPGQLKNVQATGPVVTGTLTTTVKEPNDLLVTAQSADGDSAYILVPVGKYFVQGKVLYRSGDGTEQAIDRALVGGWEPGRTGPHVTYSDSLGEYRTAVGATSGIKVTAEAPGYLAGALASTPLPDDEGLIKAAPLYLVTQDSINLVRRRAEAVAALHKSLEPLDELMGWANLIEPPNQSDPADSREIATWLSRIEASQVRPAHQEEALRRMALALELEQTAARDAKIIADDIATAIWGDGLVLLTELWSVTNGTLEITKKMSQYYGKLRGSNDPIARSLDQAKVDLALRQQNAYDLLYDGLQRVVGNLRQAPAHLTSAQKAEWLDRRTKALLLFITKRAWQNRQAALDGWSPDPSPQQQTMSVVTGPLPPGVSLDIKEAIADWLTTEYLEMVYAESRTAVLTAAKDPAGFPEGGYEVAHAAVRDKLRWVEYYREKVSPTPMEEGFKTFLNGSVEDYRGWGQLAIAAVTGGAAVPVLKQTDIGLSVVRLLISSVRLTKAAGAYSETLAADSFWSRSVREGIRAAMSAGADPIGTGGSPSADLPAGGGGRKVTFVIGEAAMGLTDGNRTPIDAAPFIQEGRTFVPLRAAAEALGATVGWDPGAQRVTLTRGSREVSLRVGDALAKVNGETRPIDAGNPLVVPLLKDGRTYAPLRFVAEAIGAVVSFDGATGTITLTLPE